MKVCGPSSCHLGHYDDDALVLTRASPKAGWLEKGREAKAGSYSLARLSPALDAGGAQAADLKPKACCLKQERRFSAVWLASQLALALWASSLVPWLLPPLPAEKREFHYNKLPEREGGGWGGGGGGGGGGQGS